MRDIIELIYKLLGYKGELIPQQKHKDDIPYYVVKADKAMATDAATNVVYPKNTQREHNKDVIDLIGSDYFQKKIGLNWSRGNYRFMTVGPGAFPYDTFEWNQSF